jgi:hypothetical protein
MVAVKRVLPSASMFEELEVRGARGVESDG